MFVVDSSDAKLFPLAQKEMQALLAQPTLAGVPLLVLLNKNDLPTAVDASEIIKELQLDTLVNRDVSYYSISCKNIINIDRVMEWVIKRATKKLPPPPPDTPDVSAPPEDSAKRASANKKT